MGAVSNTGAERWPPWLGPLALVLGFAAGLIGSAVVTLVLEGGHPHGSTLTPAETDLSTLVLDLAFVGAAVALARAFAPVRASQFGLRAPRSVGRAALLVPVGWATVFALAALWLHLVHSTNGEKGFVRDIGGYSGTLGVLAACALTTVLAPICEELLFRGFIFRSLSNWRGPWPAAIATGLLFGAVHGSSQPVAFLLPLALLGIVLCAIYQWTGSLYPCIALHSLNNAITLGATLHWNWRTLELALGALAAITLILVLVRLASARWTPATG